MGESFKLLIWTVGLAAYILLLAAAGVKAEQGHSMQTFPETCTRVALRTGQAPWVQVDMQQDITVCGVAIQRGCGKHWTNRQRAPVEVGTSEDGAKWCDISGLATDDASALQTSFVWFDQGVTARHWRIGSHAWQNLSSIINSNVAGLCTVSHCAKCTVEHCTECETGYILLHGECIELAGKQLLYLVSDTQLHDVSITASSVYGSIHRAEHVRMDFYYGRPCAWVAQRADDRPWVQFDMEQKVTVWGLRLATPCDQQWSNYRVTSFQVLMSDDGLQWEDASGPTTAQFKPDGTSMTWFNEAFTAQYWKINVLTWRTLPAMKADFVGLPKVNCSELNCIRCEAGPCTRCRFRYTLVNGECIYPDQTNLLRLVSQTLISDTSITASSEFSTNHKAERVRLDRYEDRACAWVAKRDDSLPWVKFDMEQEVTVWGVLVKLPCNKAWSNKRVTSLKVLMSNNRLKWNDVSHVITPDYSSGKTSISWFDEAATGRYWILQTLTWHGQPAMKADLLGHSKVPCEASHCVRCELGVCKKCKTGYTVENGECKVPDSQSLQYLVSDMNIDDALITASSNFGPRYTAKRVRVSAYFDGACAWVAASNDSRPWVQFDMERSVTVWGVVVKASCSEDWTSQRPKSLQVVNSVDGKRWKEVSDVITANYSSNSFSYSWFAEAVSSRYWRIEVLSWLGHPAMKADLLGKPVVPCTVSRCLRCETGPCTKCQLGYILFNGVCKALVDSDLAFLLSVRRLDDAAITASSELGLQYKARRARMDRYYGQACAWVPASDDLKPWLQFDMQEAVGAWGVVVKPPCKNGWKDNRVTSLQVVKSNNGVKWCKVSDVLTPDYSAYEMSLLYFDEVTTAQYWRINALTWDTYPAMKADLIGEAARQS